MLKVVLNEKAGISLDLDLLVHGFGTASSGGGKSTFLRLLAERAHGRIQQLILDDEGEFVTLCERFDYVIAGPNGDVAADPRTLRLLMRRMLELGFSVIVDMSELAPRDRQEAVRAVLEELLAQPRSLWRPLLVFLDEAHVYAPQKERRGHASISRDAVASFAAKARKRGFKLFAATQRFAKVDKDAVGEANARFIGLQNLPEDRKQAADFLGDTSRARINELGLMEPGTFLTVGRAVRGIQGISVVKMDLPLTKPPKSGAEGPVKPPPRAKLAKLLEQLRDLPREAEAEERSVTALQAENAKLRKELQAKPAPVAPLPPVRVEVPVLTAEDRAAFAAAAEAASQAVARAEDAGKLAQEAAKELGDAARGIRAILDTKPQVAPQRAQEPRRATPSPARPTNGREPDAALLFSHAGTRDPNRALNKGERMTLGVIAQRDEGTTRTELSILTGYKRSTRDRYLQNLAAQGLVEDAPGESFVATVEGIEALGSDLERLPEEGAELREYWLKKLPQGEAAILRILVDQAGPVERETLSERTDYKRSTRDRYLQNLQARKIVTAGPGSTVQVVQELLG